jgi:hypothetical protein
MKRGVEFLVCRDVVRLPVEVSCDTETECAVDQIDPDPNYVANVVLASIGASECIRAVA